MHLKHLCDDNRPKQQPPVLVAGADAEEAEGAGQKFEESGAKRGQDKRSCPKERRGEHLDAEGRKAEDRINIHSGVIDLN